MKNLFRQFSKVLSIALFSAAIVFSSCSKTDPISSLSDDNSSVTTISIDKKTNNNGNGNGNGGGTGSVNSANNGSSLQFPIVASKTFKYSNVLGGYRGGKLSFSLDGRSKLDLPDNALTPPPGTPLGADVTITAEVDFDSVRNEFVFTFGPHGCQFDPQVEIKLDIRGMDLNMPQLYYIQDDGTYTLEQPDQVDSNWRWLKINVNHFSRYALARS